MSLEAEVQRQDTAMARIGLGLPLPPEIIAEIFSHCLPSESEYTVPDLDTAPLILCRLCRQYRDIALSTPVLWSSLSLDMNRMTPLSLAFRDEFSSRRRMGRPGPVAPDTLKSLVQKIRDLSGQWRNILIDLQLQDDTDLQSQVDIVHFPITGQLPLLEKLDIGNLTKVTSRSLISLGDSVAPRLRCVSVRYHASMRLPWHQLTTFRSVIGLNISTALKVLRDSPNLLEAALAAHNIAFATPSGLPLVMTRQVRLQTLTLGGFAGDPDDCAVFAYLRTPALKTLRVLFNDSVHRPVDASPLISFFAQPALHLHTLILSHLPATPADLIACLAASSSLVDFTLKLAFPTAPSTGSDARRVEVDTLLAQFTRQAEFLPHLASLHLVFPGNSCDGGVSPSAVIEMLCWRWGSTPLRSFRLAHGAYYEISAELAINSHPEFARLKDEGMNLYVGKAFTDTDSFWTY
ncbi:hypothetical protein C8R46DRAFT_1084394 [Mycena filopes]|nr:hypothetical protein C8R46DRAFT_1084394 [Mycena filopes]